MGVGEEAEEADALFLYGGFLGGGVGGGEAGEEGGDGGGGKCTGDGVELSGRDGESVSVGELVEAEDDSWAEISGGSGGGNGKRHLFLYFVVWDCGVFGNVAVRLWRWQGRESGGVQPASA